MTEQGNPRARRVTKRGGEPTAANSTMHGERHAHAASWPACALAQLCSGPAPAGCNPAVCVLDKRIDAVASTEQHHAILFPKHNVYHVCFVAHNTNMCASWSALCIMECLVHHRVHTAVSTRGFRRRTTDDCESLHPLSEPVPTTHHAFLFTTDDCEPCLLSVS